MSTKNNNKQAHKDEDTKAMHGVDLHLAAIANMSIGGEAFTPPTLKAVFQADIDAIDEVDAARTTLKTKVAAARAARTRASKVRGALKTYLIGQNGPEAVQVLEDFGLEPPKAPGPRTVKAKAAGQAKAQTTRQKQKAAKAVATETPAPTVPATK